MPLLAKITIFAVLCAVILLGLFFFAKGVRNVWRAAASTRWPTTQGTVLESSTSSTVSRDSKTGVKSTIYRAGIVFGYQVGGKSYTTDLIHFGQTLGSGDSSDAELRHRRYPVGGKVSISYHPGDPSVAAAKPGVHGDVFWLPGAGLAFILPCLVALLVFSSSELNVQGFGLGVGTFAILFCLAGGAMLTAGLMRLWHAYASQYWPVASGVIVFSQRDASSSVTRDDDGTTRRSTTYSTNLVYQYDVSGKTHFANTRRFGQLSGAGADWAAEIARRYPQGAPVKVAYCPSDPDLAALEPGITSDAYWIPGIGLALFVFGLAMLIWGVPALSRDF